LKFRKKVKRKIIWKLRKDEEFRDVKIKRFICKPEADG
jgi:hypothetical protein